MSRIKHATVSSWQRDHEGKYTAEINGYTLEVFWQPESDAASDDPSKQRGFGWKATAPDGKTTAPAEVHEEIEIAMAEAENAAYAEDDAAEDDAAA